MKKYKKELLIIIILLPLRRMSQIVFDVFYSTNKEQYLGVGSGSRVQSITPLGYEEKNINLLTSSKPVPYTSSKFWKFQDWCTYGEGNCKALFGEDSLSSFRWIDAIQYVAREVDLQNPNDLSNRFAILHDMNPKRYYPYILWQYLGNPNKKSEDKVNSQIAWDNTIRLGEKWIRYHCDINKIEKIEQLSYNEFMSKLEEKDPEYRYPCASWWDLAHTVAFNYFYYLWNAEKSILYYKVASFHDNIPTITSSMPIIITGKEWNNKTSSYLWYDQLQNSIVKYSNKENLNPDEITSLESNIEKISQKMISDYSLYLLEQAAIRAQEQWREQSCYHDVDCLQKAWIINNVIDSIMQNCTNNAIDCEIIRFWKEAGRITSNGKLIHPDTERSLIYQWDEENTQRWIFIKE